MKNYTFPLHHKISENLLQFLWNRVNTTQILFKGSYEVEDMLFRNEEITIIREFQSRKEGLRYLQKLAFRA